MAENSKIEWTDHTFNPWWGCAKVPGDPACHHCYAETLAKRYGFPIWGQSKPRRFLSDRHWNEPRKWNAKAAHMSERPRVFCASMADVFESRDDLDPVRERLWVLIDETPNLDWLLLTKRPENIGRMLRTQQRRNVWLGTTAVTQGHYDARVPLLMDNGAAVHFVSVEPQMEEIVLHGGCDLPDWIICGGESGPKARPFDVQWARSLRDQCKYLCVHLFLKQLGAVVHTRNDDLWGCTGLNEPEAWPDSITPDDVIENPNGFREEYQGAPVRVKLKDRAGGDWNEWPEDLRIREVPWPNEDPRQEVMF